MATIGGNHSAEILPPKFEFICHGFHPRHSAGLFIGANPMDYSFSVIMFEMIFIMFCSRFIHLLLKPLRQPMVVSEILAAIIIGPSVLGQKIGFSKMIFSDSAQYVIRNSGLMGFMFFLFISGVQIDVSLIKNAGRENIIIAFIGVFAPVISVLVIGFFLKLPLDKGVRRVDAIGAVASCVGVTSFPVIHLALKELNLLSSEIGRKAMTVAVISDVIAFVFYVVYETAQHTRGSYTESFLYILSFIMVGVFLLICIRRLVAWVIDRTPRWEPVDQLYVVLTLLSSLVIGFIMDMFGLAITNGSLWFGLVIPSGPPLGTTIVERCKDIIMDAFMPFSFVLIGLSVDTSAMVAYGWHSLLPFLTMLMTGYITKTVVTFLVSYHFGAQWKDSLTLALMMNIRGQTEFLVFLIWLQRKSIGIPIFTMFVFLLTFVTGISTFFLTALYDPSVPYLVNRRRTIQHTPLGTELLVVVCVPSEESVPALINLIEFSNPSPRSPLMIYAIHLIELVGRSIPLLIDHKEQRNGTSDSFLCEEHMENIYNALTSYEARNDYVKFHLFTALSPKRTMYQDICYLASIKIVALIIIHLNKDEIEHRHSSGLHRDGQRVQSVNENVLTHSPCSVAIFVHKGNDQKPSTSQSFNQSQQRVMLLFLGGADAREALAYVDRMVANPIVILKVIKFTPIQDDEDSIERRLDDGMLRWFWERNESNERIFYTEVLSKNGADTLTAIQALAEDTTDLWIVGRQQGINPVLLEGLLDWNDQNDRELGVIGEFLTSDDFDSNASVLVFHQQILRG